MISFSGIPRNRSTFRRNTLAALIAAALGSTALLGTADLYAAASATPSAGAVSDPASVSDAPIATAAADAGTTPAKPADNTEFAQISQEGLGVMQSIHASRLAIFEGHTDVAKEKFAHAEQLLATLRTDLDKQSSGNAADSKSATSDTLIPIDGQIALSDAFVPTAAHQPALDKASEQITNKDTTGALDTLRLAAVDVQYTEVLMPVKMTGKLLDAVKVSLDKGDFYEANLAMLQVEQGVVVNTVDVMSTPAAN